MTCGAASAGGLATGLLLSCLLLLAPALAAAQTRKPDVNTVKSVRAVDSIVEIEVHSSREFPVRDDVIGLRIGEKDFLRSRSPENGDLHTLIFMIPAAEFAALPDGASLTVGFGRGRAELPEQAAEAAREAGRRWEFGKLDKSQLGR
jgi:hypothetical protein